MNKKILFIAFAMLSFVQLSAQVATIGNGTLTGENIPIYMYYGNTYSQSIYLNSEIGASGSITGLKWQYHENSTTHENDIEIYLGHTTQTDFSGTDNWIALTELNLVFDGTINFTPGWVEVTFSTPFQYNGTDNLVIAAREKTNGYNSDDDEFHTTTRATARSFTAYSDDVVIQPESPVEPNVISLIKNSIPNVQLLGITQNCPAPTNVTITDITSESATLSWDTGNADEWDVVYKRDMNFDPALDTSAQSIETASNSVTLTGLDSGAEYYVYVRSKCSGTMGVFTELNAFTTTANTIVPPYTNSFEDGIPVGWSTLVNSGNEWSIFTSENYAHTGSSVLSYEYNTTEAADSWLFTQGIQLTGGTAYRIGFFERVASAAYPENFKLTIGNTTTPEGQTTVLIDLPNDTNTAYVEQSGIFTPTESGTYYIAFHSYSEADQNRILIDDFFIELHTTVCTPVEAGENTGDTGCVNFTYQGQTVGYTTVRAADGNIWLQQNLGSNQVASSYDDAEAYGDLFQWGRFDDGHQLRTSTQSSTYPTPNNPTGLGTTGDTNFFIGGGSAYTGYTGWWGDWSANDKWEAATFADVTASNAYDPCKAIGEDWAIPSEDEWEAVIAAEEIGADDNVENIVSALESNLKLAVGGVRKDDEFAFVGQRGYYWSRSTSDNDDFVKFLYFSNYIVNPHAGDAKKQGSALRCMKSASMKTNEVGINADIAVYPNPTKDILYIKSDKLQQIELFDVSGKKILESNKSQINLQQQAAGLYILNVKLNNNQIKKFKVIKR